MRYAEIQTQTGTAPMLVAFNDTRARDEAAAAFGGAYFYDMPYNMARKTYDLRRYDNPRYCRSVEIGGRVYEAILKKEDARHEELAMAMTPQSVRDELRERLQLMLIMLDEEEGRGL